VDSTGMDIWFPGPCEDPEDPECGGEQPPPCLFFDCAGGGNGGGQRGSGQGGNQTPPFLPAPARFVSRWRNARTAARDKHSRSFFTPGATGPRWMGLFLWSVRAELGSNRGTASMRGLSVRRKRES
jgi:hypothetical protein